MTDFSELKCLENMNLRNFSSGMYVRLVFATDIQIDPDIMLVDEVLSVGRGHPKKYRRK
jgi:lipopolysaccharide transport system ATP-binding protein